MAKPNKRNNHNGSRGPLIPERKPVPNSLRNRAPQKIDADEDVLQRIEEKFKNNEELKLFLTQEEILLRSEKAEEKEMALAKREQDVTDRENVVTDRENALADKEKAVNQKAADADNIKISLDNYQKQLDSQNNDLISREREIIKRETNAENGFYEQNKKALSALKECKESLEKDIADLEKAKSKARDKIDKELKQCKTNKIKAVVKEADDYYKAEKIKADGNIAAMIKQHKDKMDNERALLEAEKKEIKKLSEENRTERIELEQKIKELEHERENICAERKFFEETINEQNSSRDRDIQRATEAVKNESKNKDKIIENLNKKLNTANNRLSSYVQTEREANGKTTEELLKDIDLYKEDIRNLKDKISSLPTNEQYIEAKAKAEDYDSLTEEYNNVTAELADLRVQENKWLLNTRRLAEAQDQIKDLNRLIDIKKVQIERYSDEVNRFKSLYEQPKEISARLDAIKKPFHKKREFDLTFKDEIEWLNGIWKKCSNSGIKFNKRLLYSFHTALKTADWSPLTVLAGVSGTGKSLLPEYYSRFGGLYFLSMAVQPDWDSPQSLFGYFNSVDNRFNATTLLRAMVQFNENDDAENQESNLSDSMFLILLDEMNLAHVELYFSDMLSKLERRRNTNEGVNVEIDMGAGMDKYPLELSENILWVGTMNEDETTKSLSDKVLDRGNLISFPRPKKFIRRTSTENEPDSYMLKKELWQEWLKNTAVNNADFEKGLEKYKLGLEKINEAMSYVGKALGHRVWQSVENYMANHPFVIKAFNGGSEKERERRLRESFEEALVHKVMPKLRGIEADSENGRKCLNIISDILFKGENEALAPGLEADFDNAVKNTYDTFMWNSAEYLNEYEDAAGYDSEYNDTAEYNSKD